MRSMIQDANVNMKEIVDGPDVIKFLIKEYKYPFGHNSISLTNISRLIMYTDLCVEL